VKAPDHTVQDNIKRKTNENTIRKLKGTNQKESIKPLT
jgi:hypothetical protein